MYYILFLILLTFSILEFNSGKTYKRAFLWIYLFMTFLAMFRCGQGTDYIPYGRVYEQAANSGSILNTFGMISDPIFGFAMYLSSSLGLSYTGFNILISGLMMLFFYPFFAKYCEKKIVALFFFYCPIFLVLIMSGIRQGFALSIFVGFMLPALLERRYLKYYLVLPLAMSFHASAVIFLVLPFFQFLLLSKTGHWVKHHLILILVVISCIVLIFGVNIVSLIPFDIIQRRAMYYVGHEATGNKIFAILMRILLFVPFLLVFLKRKEENERINSWYLFTFAGFFIYSFLSFSELIASRMDLYMKIFMIPLLVSTIACNSSFRKYRQLFFVYFMVLQSVFWFKTVGDFIVQGSYKNGNFLTYPYLSIFDSKSTIEYYRDDVIED